MLSSGHVSCLCQYEFLKFSFPKPSFFIAVFICVFKTDLFSMILPLYAHEPNLLNHFWYCLMSSYLHVSTSVFVTALYCSVPNHFHLHICYKVQSFAKTTFLLCYYLSLLWLLRVYTYFSYPFSPLLSEFFLFLQRTYQRCLSGSQEHHMLHPLAIPVSLWCHHSFALEADRNIFDQFKKSV